MRREIFFQSVFFVRRRLIPSCRACRSWVLLQLLTRSSNNGRRCFPPPSRPLSCFFLSSPFPHPPPCAQRTGGCRNREELASLQRQAQWRPPAPDHAF
ncbi:hypothetical protein PVAP13_5NG464940 [Panicum virgatum]|uniref:Uncharacterized protein n=1 Tax=Panicum virgatum TaxID=38727 RepID=A0A8T0RXS3_PANVG|nr:hypothetical protein PVAP13_5NG464940 [Panicum virgatum]